jgi:hypothetical protein
VLAMTSAGVAVTGTLSATSSGSFTQPSSTNTGLTVKSFSLAGGNQPLGVFQRSDAAISIELGYNGGTGNSHIGTTTAHDFEIWRGGSAIGTFSSGGLAITGSLGATTSITAMSATVTPAGGNANTGLFMGNSFIAVLFGSGAPSASATKGSLYLRTDGSGINDRMYVNTNGSTTWTAVVTVA